MAVTANSIVTPQTPNRGIVRFVGTTDALATLKSLYVAGANGSKVLGACAVNAGATAHLVTLMVVNATTAYQANAISVAASAGNNGTVTPVSLMAAAVWPGLPVDSNGNPYLFLNSGDTLQAEYATAQLTTEILSLLCVASDF
jgi:hypothetical protein